MSYSNSHNGRQQYLPVAGYEQPSSTTANMARVREEIRALTAEQLRSLKTATFVGMTAAEAREYDGRRTRITNLLRELKELEDSE